MLRYIMYALLVDNCQILQYTDFMNEKETRNNNKDDEDDDKTQAFIKNFGNKSNDEKVSTRFRYSYTPMEEVEQNPEQYVIPECLDACRILWAKNIFTGMCSNNQDDGNTWIAIEKLSEKNSKILDEIKKLGYVSFYRSWEQLIVNDEGEKAKELLERLASQFEIQDIPYGYDSIEDFLVDIGISKEVPNPIFVKKDTGAMSETDRIEYMFSPQSSETITVYDATKLQKPIQEYVEENGKSQLYLPDEGRVYDSDYYLQKHNNYLQHLAEETP